jgi:hypothetical protein
VTDKTFTFRVPGPPERGLAPNENTGYKPRGYITKLKGQARASWNTAIVAERNNMGVFEGDPPMFPGKVVAEITHGLARGRQAWDPDGLISALKWGLDQLQVAGVIRDDEDLDPVVKEQVRDPDGSGYIEVTLREKE